jgi:hypothetical protein
MVEKLPWPTPFWVYTALNVLSLILTILFVKETYYDRDIPPESQPSTGNRLTSLSGYAQFKSRHLRNTIGQAVWRVISVIIKPTNFLANLFYVLVRITRQTRL